MPDDDELAKTAEALRRFGFVAEADRPVLSTQVLQEFYVSVTRTLADPLPLEAAEARVRDFSKHGVYAPLILATIGRSHDRSGTPLFSLRTHHSTSVGAAYILNSG